MLYTSLSQATLIQSLSAPLLAAAGAPLAPAPIEISQSRPSASVFQRTIARPIVTASLLFGSLQFSGCEAESRPVASLHSSEVPIISAANLAGSKTAGLPPELGFFFSVILLGSGLVLWRNNSQLKAKLVKKDNEYVSLQIEFATVRQLLSTLKNRDKMLGLYQAHLDAGQVLAQLQEAEAEAAQLQGRIDQLSRTRQDVQSLIQRLKQAQTQVELEKEDLQTLQETRDRVVSELEGLQVATEKLRDELNVQETEVLNYVAARDQVQGELDGLKETETKLQTETDELTQRRIQLATSNDERRALIDGINIAIEELNQRQKGLEREQKKQAAIRDRLESELEGLEAQHAPDDFKKEALPIHQHAQIGMDADVAQWIDLAFIDRKAGQIAIVARTDRIIKHGDSRSSKAFLQARDYESFEVIDEQTGRGVQVRLVPKGKSFKLVVFGTVGGGSYERPQLPLRRTHGAIRKAHKVEPSKMPLLSVPVPKGRRVRVSLDPGFAQYVRNDGVNVEMSRGRGISGYFKLEPKVGYQFVRVSSALSAFADLRAIEAMEHASEVIDAEKHGVCDGDVILVVKKREELVVGIAKATSAGISQFKPLEAEAKLEESAISLPAPPSQRRPKEIVPQLETPETFDLLRPPGNEARRFAPMIKRLVDGRYEFRVQIDAGEVIHYGSQRSGQRGWHPIVVDRPTPVKIQTQDGARLSFTLRPPKEGNPGRVDKHSKW